MQKLSTGAGPYDRDWAKLSRSYRRAHPICEVVGCGQNSAHVDHIETIASAPWRRLDRSNLQALCHHHHSALTMAYDMGRLDGACNGDGMPLDPNHPWNAESNAEAIESANTRRQADPRLAAKLKRRYVNGFQR